MNNQKAFKTAISLEGAMMIPDELADRFDSINNRRDAALNAHKISLQLLGEQFTAALLALDIEADAAWKEAIDALGADASQNYQVSRGVRPAVIVPQDTIDKMEREAAHLQAQQAAEAVSTVADKSPGPTHPAN